MLTSAEIDEFHRTGFASIKQVFAGPELEALRAAADTVVAEGSAGRGRDHWSREIDGKQVYFRSEHLWRRDGIFRAAAVHPRLLECVGQLMGHPFLPLNDSMVCKLPRGRVPVEWHQDPPYQGAEGLKDTFGVPNIDVDIYLDDATERNGCLWVIPEHHLVGKVDLQGYREEELFRDHGAVPMRMRAGDVGFHALSAPHGSIGNASDDIRRIVFFHYLAREVYESFYGWMNHNGGFSPEGIEFVREMLRTREALNHSEHGKGDAALTNDGFVFTGTPRTPPFHWQNLIARIPERDKERKRRLQSLPASAIPAVAPRSSP